MEKKCRKTFEGEQLAVARLTDSGDGVSVLKEIAVLKDLFDLVDFEAHNVLDRLEGCSQVTHKLVDIEGILGDDVQLYSVVISSVGHFRSILSQESFATGAATTVPPWLLVFDLCRW